MAKGTVHYDLTANEAPAVDAFRKLTKEQQKAALAFSKTSQAAGEMEQRATRAGRNSKNAFDPFSKSAEKISRSLQGLIVGAFSISAVTSAFDAFAQSAERSNAALMEMTKASLALRAILPATQGDTLTREVAKQGSIYGIMPSEAISTFQRMYSLLGDMGKAKRAAQESYQLQALGATEEGAAQAIQFGADKGLTPEQSSTMAMIAANRSVLDVNEISRSISAIQGFDTAQFGAGALAAMSGSFRSEELRTYTQAAGRAINDTQGDFFKRMSRDAGMFGVNFASLSNEDRLEYLSQRFGGDVSENQLRELGLREVEQSRGLAALIRNAPKAFDVAQEIRTVDTGEEDRVLLEQLKNSPDFQEYIGQKILEAQSSYVAAYGKSAEPFRAMNKYKTERGAELLQTYAGPYVTDENGRLNNFGMAMDIPEAMGWGPSLLGAIERITRTSDPESKQLLTSIEGTLKQLASTLAPPPQKVQVRAD